jgi:hypothetical protein
VELQEFGAVPFKRELNNDVLPDHRLALCAERQVDVFTIKPETNSAYIRPSQGQDKGPPRHAGALVSRQIKPIVEVRQILILARLDS